MDTLISRTGRELQRYTDNGGRFVVGCIPYRFNKDETLEVLVITSQKGKGMLFPKGGWEQDESAVEAVHREAMEESGVGGILKEFLGEYNYISKRYGIKYVGYMYSLEVMEELEQWPEMHLRNRKWVTVAEAREQCQYIWMKEALNKFIQGIKLQKCRPPQIEEDGHGCGIFVSNDILVSCT